MTRALSRQVANGVDTRSYKVQQSLVCPLLGLILSLTRSNSATWGSRSDRSGEGEMANDVSNVTEVKKREGKKKDTTSYRGRRKRIENPTDVGKGRDDGRTYRRIDSKFPGKGTSTTPSARASQPQMYLRFHLFSLFSVVSALSSMVHAPVAWVLTWPGDLLGLWAPPMDRVSVPATNQGNAINQSKAPEATNGGSRSQTEGLRRKRQIGPRQH